MGAAAANQALGTVAATLTQVSGSAGRGVKLTQRMQHEERLNAMFIWGGFAFFLATVLWVLFVRRLSLFSVVFGSAVLALVLTYAWLYMTCFRSRSRTSWSGDTANPRDR